MFTRCALLCVLVGAALASPVHAEGSGSGTDGWTEVPWYQGTPIDYFLAETPAAYHTPVIRPVPAKASLGAAVRKGWTQSVRCALACRVVIASSTRRVFRTAKVSVWFPSAGHGRIRVRLTSATARALRGYRRTVRLEYRVIVNDGRGPVVRDQTLM